MSADLILAVEAGVLLLAVLLLSKRPVCCGIVSAALGFGVAVALHGMWSLGPFEKTIGADLVGKQFMKAAVFDANVAESVSFDPKVPVPDMSSRHVLVDIKAASLNPSNYKMNPSVVPFVRHAKKHIVGYDFAGKVLAVGSDPSCQHLKVGDDVYGMCMGSIAEYGSCFCRTVSKKSKSLNYLEAASLPVVALTTQEAYASHRGNLKKGNNVLVIGASGGCGIYGVKIAKAEGGKVTGICSTKNVDFVKGLGTDSVVDYKNDKQMKALIAGGKQFDVIYDTVSSFDPVDPDYVPTMFPLLKDGGMYIAINGEPKAWVAGILDFFLGLDFHTPNYQLFLLSPSPETLKSLADMFDNGAITIGPLAETFKLNSDKDIVDAFAKMKSRRTVGKLVFDLS